MDSFQVPCFCLLVGISLVATLPSGDNFIQEEFRISVKYRSNERAGLGRLFGRKLRVKGLVEVCNMEVDVPKDEYGC